MKNTIKGVIWMIVIGLLLKLVSAQSITNIQINNNALKINDELDIFVNVSNELTSEIYLNYIIAHIPEEIAPVISDRIKINPNTIEMIQIYNTRINEIDFRNGDYSIIAILTDETQNVYDFKTLNFTVSGLPEEFDIELRSCKSKSCQQKSKIFLLEQNIYLTYKSEIPKLSITAVLTYPDKKSKQIILPTTIKAEQIGTYILEVRASKDGYKTITKKEMFGVIEKDAEIEYESFCNDNGVCDRNENPQNCPSDCIVKIIEMVKEPGKTVMPKYLNENEDSWIALSLIMIFAVLLLFLVHFSIKKSKK